MQKKIIALAVAALASSAAFAQSNVTVYGIADVGQAFVKSSGAANGVNQGTVGRLDSNSSYLGFKGVEDLGNGLKALFQFETGFAADKGFWSSTATSGRDSYVGLTSNFGTVLAGNLTHPLRGMAVRTELLPAAAGLGVTQSVLGTVAVPTLHGGTVRTGADDRAANALAYVSPTFAGFSGTVAYVNGENKQNASTGTPSNVNTKAWQVYGQYENGPAYVGVGYHKAYDWAGAGAADGSVGIAAADGQNASVWRVAGVYTFPTNTKLTALYDRTKVVDLGGNGGDDVKRTAYSLGVAQGFGKNTVGLEYAASGKLKSAGESVDNTKVHMITALYTYELSKRTMLTARYSRLTNDSAVNTNFYTYNNPVNNGVSTGAGSDYTGYMVGLRHAF